MLVIPSFAQPLLDQLAPVFSQPTYQRLLVLLMAAILTTGRRTVSNLLRSASGLAPGDPSSYHRVFSKWRWSTLQLARLLAKFLLDHFVGDGPVFLAATIRSTSTAAPRSTARTWNEITVTTQPVGSPVQQAETAVDCITYFVARPKGCHRDPVRSTHLFRAYRWGHKWVVLAILVPFPFATRAWALPVLVALYRCADKAQTELSKTLAWLNGGLKLCCIAPGLMDIFRETKVERLFAIYGTEQAALDSF